MKYRKSPTYAKALQETIQMHKRNVKRLSTSYQIRQAGLFGNATLIKKKFNSDSAAAMHHKESLHFQTFG